MSGWEVNAEIKARERHTNLTKISSSIFISPNSYQKVPMFKSGDP